MSTVALVALGIGWIIAGAIGGLISRKGNTSPNWAVNFLRRRGLATASDEEYERINRTVPLLLLAAGSGALLAAALRLLG